MKSPREADEEGRNRQFHIGCLIASLWLLFPPCVGQFTFVTASLCFWAFVEWTHQKGPQCRTPSAEGRDWTGVGDG